MSNNNNIKVIKSVTLDVFKEIVNTAKIIVKKSPKTGNLYGLNEGQDLICRFPQDINFEQPIMAMEMLNTEDETSWWFCANGTPSETVREL